MIGFELFQEPNSVQHILCLGAHSDDIEIGCGGTILKLVEKYPEITFHWIVFSSDERRAVEARESAHRFLQGIKRKEIVVKNFRDGYFPYIGGEIKDYFEQLIKEISPDCIFTHYQHDLHQDHRLISELTWNTFRNHLILEYEIPKYDGDLGSPNLYVPISEELCVRKIENLIEFFQTQKNKQWFTEETFRSILKLRGVESNSPDKYAEAFFCRKFIWEIK